MCVIIYTAATEVLNPMIGLLILVAFVTVLAFLNAFVILPIRAYFGWADEEDAYVYYLRSLAIGIVGAIATLICLFLATPEINEWRRSVPIRPAEVSHFTRDFHILFRA